MLWTVNLKVFEMVFGQDPISSERGTSKFPDIHSGGVSLLPVAWQLFVD